MGWKLHDGADFDDSDENSLNAQELCAWAGFWGLCLSLCMYVFIKFTGRSVCVCVWGSQVRLAAGGAGVTNATRGHDERLCRELEVDTEGQR